MSPTRKLACRGLAAWLLWRASWALPSLSVLFESRAASADRSYVAAALFWVVVSLVAGSWAAIELAALRRQGAVVAVAVFGSAIGFYTVTTILGRWSLDHALRSALPSALSLVLAVLLLIGWEKNVEPESPSAVLTPFGGVALLLSLPSFAALFGVVMSAIHHRPEDLLWRLGLAWSVRGWYGAWLVSLVAAPLACAAAMLGVRRGRPGTRAVGLVVPLLAACCAAGVTALLFMLRLVGAAASGR